MRIAFLIVVNREAILRRQRAASYTGADRESRIREQGAN